MKITYYPSPLTRSGEVIKVRDIEPGEIATCINNTGKLVTWKIDDWRGTPYIMRHIAGYNPPEQFEPTYCVEQILHDIHSLTLTATVQ